jgi:hypothetical protein
MTINLKLEIRNPKEARNQKGAGTSRRGKVARLRGQDKVCDEVEDTVSLRCSRVTGRSRVMSKCHGLSRVMSRVAREKRPVFIMLSRCHGLRGV